MALSSHPSPSETADAMVLPHTAQFHPYERPTAVPVAERARRPELKSLADNIGIDPAVVDRVDDVLAGIGRTLRLRRARSYARANPAVVLACVAALVIGAALVAGRVARRRVARNDRDRSSGAA
jgi:hypothetical protein